MVKGSITPSEDINSTVTDLLDGRSDIRLCLAITGTDVNATSVFLAVHLNAL